MRLRLVLRRARHSAVAPPHRRLQLRCRPSELRGRRPSRATPPTLVRASSSSHHDLTFRELPCCSAARARTSCWQSAVFAARLLARPDGADAAGCSSSARAAASHDGGARGAGRRPAVARWCGCRSSARACASRRPAAARRSRRAAARAVGRARRGRRRRGGGARVDRRRRRRRALRELLSKTGDVPLPPGSARRAARRRRALPGGLRQRRRRARRADRLAPLHRRRPRRPRRRRDTHLARRAARRRRHLQAGDGRARRRPRCTPSASPSPRTARRSRGVGGRAPADAGTTSARVLESLYWLGARELASTAASTARRACASSSGPTTACPASRR